MKLTTEEYIAKAKIVHGDKYDYSKTIYNGVRNKIIVICPIHGEYETTGRSHLKCNCPKCSDYSNGKDVFIEKAESVHGARYDYSRVVYVNSKVKVEIVCDEHGSFMQIPNSHISSGRGCPKCSRKYGNHIHAIKKENKKPTPEGYTNKHTAESFINKAIEIHGGLYDYNKIVYVNGKTNVEIVCRKHGSFMQTPNSHLMGSGCNECGRERTIKSVVYDEVKFIEKAREVHGDLYNYSRVNYINSITDVEIVCKKHGSFLQTYSIHVIGKCGCPKCSPNYVNTEKFINKATLVHGNLYDYSKVIYETTNKNVEIICKKHGSFFQMPLNHLKGKGCFNCSNGSSVSKGETEMVEYIKSICSFDVDINTKRVISPYELDIYIPSLNLAIEYNGLYWHSERNKHDTYHKAKNQACVNKGIRLIQIWEHEWYENRELCKEFLKSLIVQTKREYARKFHVKQVPIEQQREFLNKYHFQGYSSASSVVGLYDFNDELIQLMSFKKLNQIGDYEIGRLCTKSGYAVVGGAERLFKKLVEENNPKSLISYNNLDKFTGEVYSRLGMLLESSYIRSYFYYKGSKAFPRQQFQKHKLVEQGHDPNLTEVQIANSMGYYRVFPTGNSKYKIEFS